MASSTIVEALLRLQGVNETGGTSRHHFLLRHLMPNPKIGEYIPYLTSFMVVRHPFSRILSAYRYDCSKIENFYMYYFFLLLLFFKYH